MVKGDDTGHTSRNGVQIGFSVNPQLRFVFSVCLWISMASSTLLFHYPGFCLSILAFSQSTQCWCSHACTAIPMFVSSLLTAALCSTNLFFRLLLVSPMYELLQSIHGTSYTTSFFQQLWSRILHSHQCFAEGSSRLEHCLYSYLSANLLYVLWLCVAHMGGKSPSGSGYLGHWCHPMQVGWRVAYVILRI